MLILSLFWFDEKIHVVCILPKVKIIFPQHFKYLEVTARDTESQDLLTIVPFCVDFIQEAVNSGGDVLIHCGAGVSRSAMIMIAYIMCTQHNSFEKSLQIVQNIRCCVCPNKGFQNQLELLEEIGCNLDIIRQKQEPYLSKIKPYSIGEATVIQYSGFSSIRYL
eukprot:TRINITY_DN6445_c0_g1_i1.p1 TRINITY_DN6445_c0_g1~~TRINITY_DN6445_c0_g1_i1.p1  ORF type:complete len:164 (-),score=12.19 TRINITY_DN6445_c0_g1_i1:57-548(-)